MKKFIFAAVASLAAASAFAAEPLGYPGSTWGQLTFPSSVIADTPEHGNWVYQGKITQGIDWVKFGSDKKWTLDTYASLGLSDDRNHLAYNDKVVPALGVRLDRSYNNGIVTVGVEGVYEHHWGDVYNGSQVVGSPVKMNGAGVQAYVSYWFGWNLKK